jgi:hypothetical protein
MANDKKILVTIPEEFNTKLTLHLLKVRNLGVNITKAELIINMAQIGLKHEDK